MAWWYAVDARDGFAQRLAFDAARDCQNMSAHGRFQYVSADDGQEAITVAQERYASTKEKNIEMSATVQKSRYAQAAASIKKELAQVFPGIKFSVRSKSFSGGNSVDVSWSLGPTSEEVNAILTKYQDGHFDSMDDSYNYDRDPTCRAVRSAHGSAKYVSGHREISQALFERICRDVADLQGVSFRNIYQRGEDETLDLGDYTHRALARTSFPAGAEYIRLDYGFELTLTGSCASGEAYRIVHTMTDEEEEMRQVIRQEFDRIKAREKSSVETVTVVFHPQAWQNDYAIAVDPEGPTTFQVPRCEAPGLQDDTYESDALHLHANAPEWIREWTGPFFIEIER